MARRLSRVRFQVCIRQGVAPIFALTSSTEVFRKSGVDAAVREIAEKAAVGLGTVYRHFPQRSDLIVAVFQTQVNACADAASVIASKYEPGDALARWMQGYVDFISTKRGLAAALHSGDPAYIALPAYFNERLQPALRTLLDAAVAARVVRPGIEADDLLRVVATLCRGPHDEEPSMREEWSNCWWMACVTERARESTRPKTRRRRSMSPATRLLGSDPVQVQGSPNGGGASWKAARARVAQTNLCARRCSRAKSQRFVLQKAVAIACRVATGLRNGALPYDF
jgi:AcrR family transcriptional regulator